MGTRIEVWKNIKVNGLERRKTLLQRMYVEDHGVYMEGATHLRVWEEAHQYTPVTTIVLNGMYPLLRLTEGHTVRTITGVGNVVREGLRYNKEIVVYRTESQSEK